VGAFFGELGELTGELAGLSFGLNTIIMVAAVKAAYLPAFDRASLRDIAPECRGVSVGCVFSELFSDGEIICEFVFFSMCENFVCLS
jgi:hypothetical protein